jgi:Icc-related predicted phosphoesterase
VIRIAAVGDVHLDAKISGRFRPALDRLPEIADLLLVAGDLTRRGTVAEARCVATEFGGLAVPVVAVLGNHDYHSDLADEMTAILRDAGIVVLDGDSHTVEAGGVRVAVAGLCGFGGGFSGATAADFGEREMKSFTAYGREQADRLRAALEGADGDVLIALTHYAPIRETLVGEPVELYPFLGSHLLAEAIDATGVALALHGHAHYGSPEGVTAGGVPVRNVAHPVIGREYAVFDVPVSGHRVEAVAGNR